MNDGTPLDYSFYEFPRGFADVLAEARCDGIITGAENFFAFGEYDFAEGGGANPWLVVSANDSGVFAIDAGSEFPSVLLNSSLTAFIETFCLLNQYLGARLQLPASIRDSAERIDPNGYPNSEWRDWIEYLLDS